MARQKWRARGTRGADPRGVYPERWEADVVLRDGTSAHVRPIVPGDAKALKAFHAGLSVESRFFRFHTSKQALTPSEIAALVQVDYRSKLALVVTLDDALIAVGRYTALSPETAEVAFVVADAFQGKGLGTILCDHLAAAARECGIRTFVAEVLPGNDRMLTMFDAAGYDVTRTEHEGLVKLSVSTGLTERVLGVLEERERAAEARAIGLMFDPASIMIVGASRTRDHVGAQIVRALVASGYAGRVYPVNPEADEINGLRTFARITDVPGPVDLAVLAIRADRCVDAMDELAATGVRAVVAVSAGFADSGADGARHQERLMQKARSHGIRVLGPASLGFFRTGERGLNVSLSPRVSPRGSIALAGQSTALSAMVLAGADARGLRIREFLSAGNRADISLNDALQRWGGDPEVSLVALSLESMGNPRKFTRLVRRMAPHTPVVVVRPPNVEELGSVDALSSLSSLPSDAMDQILDAAGAIRTHSVDHLLDAVSVLSREGRAHGRRVGLLSNSGALGATLQAAAHESGLDIVDTNVRVPIVGDDRLVSRAFAAMAGPGGVDSVIVAILDTQRVDLVHLARELGVLARGAAVQVLMVVVTDEPRLRHLRDAVRHDPELPPVFSTATRATDALAAALQASPGGAGALAARRAVGQASASGGRDRLEGMRAASEARAALREVAPVGWEETSAHRSATSTDAPHEVVDAERARSVLEHYDLAPPGRGESRARPVLDASSLEGGTGVDVVVRVIDDPVLGPVLSFSHVGPATDVYGDVAYATAPLSLQEASRIVAAPRASVTLNASAPVGTAGRTELVELVHRASLLIDDLPEVAELVLSPIRVSSRGVVVGGAEFTVGPPPRRLDGLRRTVPGSR